MHVEERCFGVPFTPEVRALVRNVFERSFHRLQAHVDQVKVRLFSVREGVECRAVLWPSTGSTLAITEIRPSTVEAVLACANGLALEVQHRYITHGRRSRRQRVSQRRRAKLAA